MKNARLVVMGILILLGIYSAIGYFHSAEKKSVDENKIFVPTAGVPKNPFLPDSAAYREAENFWRWLPTDSVFMQYAKSKSTRDIYALANSLEAEGISRLPDAEIEDYAFYLSKVIGAFDDIDCAALLKGRLSSGKLAETAYPVLSSFSDEDARRWFEINKLAIGAAIAGDPVKEASRVIVREAVRNLSSQLPAHEADRLNKTTANPNSKSDSEICSAVKILFSGASRMSEPFKGNLSRLLVTAKSH
jgi:hypothetical protein